MTIMIILSIFYQLYVEYMIRTGGSSTPQPERNGMSLKELETQVRNLTQLINKLGNVPDGFIQDFNISKWMTTLNNLLTSFGTASSD